MISAELEAAIRQRIAQFPIVEQIGMEILKFDAGYCEARVERNPAWDGVFQCVHGGMLMTIADTLACWAVLTLAGAEATLTTTDMNIRFLSPCVTAVIARAQVIKAGRTMNPVAVDLYDEAGKQVAVAQVNYMLLDRMPGR